MPALDTGTLNPDRCLDTHTELCRLPDPDIQVIRDGPAQAAQALILAHGAGQGSDSPFLQWFSVELARARLSGGLSIWRFDFPYMAMAKTTNMKRPPDRATTLEAAWGQAISEVRRQSPRLKRLFIGGKSMGGRIASMVADHSGVDGLVCLGYPFHPPGQPEKLRTTHLETLDTPALICQGERDPFGSHPESSGWQLADVIKFCWLADGDHNFKPRKKSGWTEEQNRVTAREAILGFVGDLPRKPG
ncbi:MAG: alpha/beta family hydrolase [Pseudomonadota bacterium]|nr:alpha/beta family hydrolase [Pseudomonadota bacterium]